MGLFTKKNKDFSGSPTADETASYNGTTRNNTLHKRGATNPTTTGATTNGATHPTTGINDPSIDGNGEFMGRTSEDRSFESPQQYEGGRHSGSLGRHSGNRAAGTTGLGSTGAGASVGGPTYGSRGTNMGNNMGGNDDLGIARGKVHAAEAAEREALRMLAVARTAVKEAHEHVDRLARDADEDARRAGLKQQEIHSLRQDTQHLGQSFT